MIQPHPPAPRRGRPLRAPSRRVRAAALAAVVMAAATIVVVATTGTQPAAAGPPPVMRGYVPLPTNDFQGYLESVNTDADTTIAFTVGITNAAAGATIYYDHREDGFEADIANPVQSSTLVLGDGNVANGNAGTYCTACAGDLLPQGAPLIMRSSIPTPRTSARFFDGGDKVASTRGITITAGGFSTPLSSVLSGVVSAYDTSKYGTSYTVPVGEDTPVPSGATNAFSYTGASIMAANPGTEVQIDRDGNGSVDRTDTIGEGGSVFVDGTLREGATIRSSSPVQVHLLTGRRTSDYEARSFTLYPDDVLSNDYMSPAGSGRTNFRTVNYLYNPTSAPLTVTPSCTGCSGTISIPAGASAAFHSPVNQGVRFQSSGGRFIAIAGVGAQSGAAPGGGANESRVYDWGFSMLPTSQLTTQVALGWAPGNSNTPPSTSGTPTQASYDPVWVTTLTATTVHVDFDGNPSTGTIGTADCFGARHDREIPVAALASTRIFDPDGDMTGARVYTCDGTEIAGAWGQDPTVASQAAPGFDAGYTIIPTTAMVLEKSARIADDVDGDGGFGPGDTMTYELAIADAGSLAFTDVEASDVLEPGLTYVPGSTRLVSGTTTTPIADDGPPAATPFPLDELGLGLPDIAAGQTVYLRFEADIAEPWVNTTASVGNTACVRAAEAVACDTSATALTDADVSLTKTRTSPAGPDGTVGEEATFEIVVANAGPDTAPGVEVTDLLPAGLDHVGDDPSQGSYDPVTGIWDVGDIADGGQATLEITASVLAAGTIVNTAEVTGGGFVDPDSIPGNGDEGEDDQGEAEVDFAPVIDLELGKEVSAPPTADGTTEFTITLDNPSVSEATGVVVDEIPPAGAEWISAVPSRGSFDQATGEWAVGTVAAGGTEQLVVTYRIDDLPAVNRAEVVAADQADVDSTPGNADDRDEDDDAEVDVVSGFVDLSVDKTVTPDPWTIGEDVTFTVTVANDGPADATGVEVTDQLPAGFDLVSATPSVGSYDDGTGVWTVGSVGVGDDATLEIVATITAAGSLTNLAQVTAADQPDVDSTPDETVDGEDDERTAGLDVDGATLGDRVWDDRDGDGAQDPGEPGLVGVTVRVTEDTDGDGTDETPIATVLTGADGIWTLDGLDGGSYRVVVDPTTAPTGAVATTATTIDVELADLEVVLDADVGFTTAADLSVAKSLIDAADPSVGDDVTYRVTVANQGPAGATGVVVGDELPAGLTFVSSDPSQGTYSPATGLWTVGTLANGVTATLDLVATITSAEPITNTASVVGSDQDDPEDENDASSAPIDAEPLVDLTVDKTIAGTPPTHLGDQVTFLVTVANGGPSGATGVEVSDLLPDGLGFVSATASTGTYDEGTGLWSVGAVAADDEATLEVVATVEALSVTNVAEVVAAGEEDATSTPGNGPGAEEDDDAAALVEVDPLVALEVTKTLVTEPAAVGLVAGFEIDVTNRGPSVATGVEVTELLPDGLTLVSFTPSAGTYDPETGVWSIGAVAVDGVETLEITATLGEGGPVTNGAELTDVDQDDATTDDDRDEAEVTAPGASIGDRVWDDLDGDGTQDDGEPGLDGVTVRLLRDGDEIATTTTDDGAYLFDGLAPGDHQVVADATTVPAGHVATTPATVSVTVTAGEAVTTADIGFSGAADLVVAKELTNAPTYVGDTATFRVRVTNRGPATATGVVVADPAPAGLVLVDAEASQGTFAGGEWSVGELVDQESATVDLTYRVDVEGPITNRAEVVEVDQDDPTPEDTVATDEVDVDALIDLELTKTEVGEPEFLGQRAVFEITVTNAGPSTATAVAVTDRLPAGLAFLSADAEVGTYDETTGVWAVGEVPDGASYTLEIRAQINALSVTNGAEVSGAAQDDLDSTPGNGAVEEDDDWGEAEVIVAPRADLELTKTATEPDFVGQTATFTLEITNLGPSLATGVEVTDDLPAGLTYVSAAPSAGAYDPDTGIWTIGAIPVDGAETLVITTRLDVLGPVVNVAEVTAVDQADPDSTPANGPVEEDDDRDEASVRADGGTIGDRVWDDLDADGTQDDGEPGIEGVTVTLQREGADGFEDVDSTTTGTDGAYAFGDLLPGRYRVVVDNDTAPDGSVPTTTTSVVVDLVPGVDGDDADVGFSTAVRLLVDKTLVDAPTSVGDTATFAVVVTNQGPATATGVVVGDELPDGLAFTSATATQGAYDQATGRWSVGTLAEGTSATLTLVTRATAETAENTAEVLAVDQDDLASTPGNADDEPDEDDTDTATVDVDALIDLSLAKELTVEPTHLGDDATFVVTVTNAGPSPATGVEVTDLLPAGLDLVSATPSAGTYDEDTGVWTVGSVGVGAAAAETLTVVATVEALDVTNTAEVTDADQADASSTPGNAGTDPGEDDVASADVEVAPLADLSLVKTEASDPEHLGDIATFVITVANAGPSPATAVQVADALPAGLGYVSANATSGSYDTGIGLWSIPTIPSESSATLTLRARVLALDVTNGAEVVAVAEDDPDSQPGEDPLGPDDEPNQDDEGSARVEVDALVDLSISKVETANPTVIGDRATFLVTIANGGPAVATGVEVTDLLPAGLTFVSADPEVGTYDETTGVWAVGSLAVGGDATLEVVAIVGALDVTNTAEVTAATEDDADSTPGNGPTDPAEDDRGSARVQVEPRIDLELTKELTAAPTHVGDEATFTLTVANAGPSAATGVEVTDLLPDDLTWVGDDGAGAYDRETGVWTVGTVGVLASRTLTITARVGSTRVVNLAQVTEANEIDLDSAPAEDDLGPEDPPDQDDEAAAVVTARPLADLSLGKTSTPSTVAQGDEATFVLTVTNDGPSPATGIVVTDELPDGVTFGSATASQGAYDAATGFWTVGDLAATGDGAVATLSIVVTVTAAGDVTNVAEITTVAEDDPSSTPGNGTGDDGEDDHDTTTLSSEPRIDLSVGKTASSPSASVGDEVTFTVTVANDGPSAATGVEVTDQLPAGLTHVSHSASAGTWAPGTGVWTVGDLAVGGTATLEVRVSVDRPGPITNRASVTDADQVDVDSTPGNAGAAPLEDDTADAAVAGVQVDLHLGITADRTSVNVFDTVTYTITVGNDGPSGATGVAAADLLPVALAFVSATASQGSFDPDTGTWSVGALPAGATVTLEIVATVLEPGPIDNAAEVSAAEEPDVDSTPGNGPTDPAEDDRDVVTITGLQVDLDLTKTVDATSPSLGGDVTYTLTVTNEGPSTATGVIVSDGLPDGLRWVGDTGDGAYDPDTGLWDVGAVGVGASRTIDITTEVVGTGPLTNRAAVVAADQPDRDSTPGNDDGTEDDQAEATITAQTASVSGIVWLDLDGDGRLDAGEPRISGVTVLLVTADGDLAGSTVTDGDGAYRFDDVAPGDYVVAVDEYTLPDTIAGQTYDPDDVVDGAHPITLGAGEARADVDFGYRPAPSAAPSAAPPVEAGSDDDGLGRELVDLLAQTGSTLTTPLGAGLGLVLLGLVLVVVRRRRLA